MKVQKNITVLPGDGIGPEVTDQAIKVIKAVAARFGHNFQFNFHHFGGSALDHCGEPLPPVTLQACKEADAVLLGAIGGPKYDSFAGNLRPEFGLLQLRKELGLYANLRPVKYYTALAEISPLKPTVARGTDLIIFRELTGGSYFGKQEWSADGKTATDTCTYSEDEIIRIARMAFKSAMTRRKKVSLVDKANVLATSRLWRRVVEEVAREFPEVNLEKLYVDHAAMKLITAPASFDVILTENLFGDILSDEASVITGSLGMLPSASIGIGHSLYEPIHGSWPEATGKGKANPMGAILSVAMMLDYSFNLKEEASLIREAVRQSLRLGLVTPDLEPSSGISTAETGDIIANVVLEESGSLI